MSPDEGTAPSGEDAEGAVADHAAVGGESGSETVDFPDDAQSAESPAANEQEGGEVNDDPPTTSAEDEFGAPNASTGRKARLLRVLAYGVVPALIVCTTATAGFFKWQESTASTFNTAGTDSLQVARDTTVALLSYKADTVDNDLEAASQRLTGEFKSRYLNLAKDVVIPGAKQQKISTTATVPAAATVSDNRTHAVALLFVNQRTMVGSLPPTDLQSSVRVVMDKVDGRWLVSGFDPI